MGRPTSVELVVANALIDIAASTVQIIFANNADILAVIANVRSSKIIAMSTKQTKLNLSP